MERGTLFMQPVSGGIPEAIRLCDVKTLELPDDEPAFQDEHWGTISADRTFTCTGTIRPNLSARARKWWACLSRYGNWRAKGPIRMRMLGRAAALKTSEEETFHFEREADGVFRYRRGDGAVVELHIDKDDRKGEKNRS